MCTDSLTQKFLGVLSARSKKGAILRGFLKYYFRYFYFLFSIKILGLKYHNRRLKYALEIKSLKALSVKV